MTTDDNWKRLFDIKSADNATGDVDLVQIEDIFVDSNARKQQSTPVGNEYAYQHSADFQIRGTENSRVKNVIVNNVYFDDRVSRPFIFFRVLIILLDNVPNYKRGSIFKKQGSL